MGGFKPTQLKAQIDRAGPLQCHVRSCPPPPPRQEYRGTIVDQLCRDSLGKRGLSCSPDLRLTHFLTTEHCIGRWLLEGLPRDELSIQNAVIVSQSARCGPADGRPRAVVLVFPPMCCTRCQVGGGSALSSSAHIPSLGIFL